MIKKLMLLSLIVLTASCQNTASKEGYVLTGTIDKTIDGKTIRLRKADASNSTLVDSMIVKDGKVSFTGSVDSPDLYLITIDDLPGGMPIVLENETITVEFFKDSLQTSVVTGSHENDIFKKYKDIADPIRAKNETMGQEFMAARTAGDTAKMNAIQAEFKKIIDQANVKNQETIKKHNDVVTSAAILENLINTKSIESAKAKELYDNFTEPVKNSRIGKSIADIMNAAVATEIGSVAPAFSAPNPEGKTLALKDIKGKVTIIDFWAAWCGPCRRENPNVVKIYDKYHEKGLEIIGVSLDGSPRQPNAKDEWIKAIKDDGLTWHQVSNLNFFDDPIAKLYNIQAIPATFILDSEGKIVAKNLRGDELDAKIAELLN